MNDEIRSSNKEVLASIIKFIEVIPDPIRVKITNANDFEGCNFLEIAHWLERTGYDVVLGELPDGI